MAKYVIANTDNTKFLELKPCNDHLKYLLSSTSTLFDTLFEANEYLIRLKSPYIQSFISEVSNFSIKEVTITIN